MSMRRKVEEGEQSDFAIRNDGALVIGSRLCVPAAEELKGQILGEAHSSTYAIDSCHGRVSGINKICFLCSSYCRSQATAA